MDNPQLVSKNDFQRKGTTFALNQKNEINVEKFLPMVIIQLIKQYSYVSQDRKYKQSHKNM